MDSPYFALPPVPSSVAPVAAAEWPGDQRSAFCGTEAPTECEPDHWHQQDMFC